MDRLHERLRPQVLDGFQRLSQRPDRDGATWREVAKDLGTRGVINAQAPSEVRLVRMTAENLVKARQLHRVGSDKPAGQRNWEGIYKPAASMRGEELLQVATLTDSMRAWAQALVAQECEQVQEAQR